MAAEVRQASHHSLAWRLAPGALRRVEPQAPQRDPRERGGEARRARRAGRARRRRRRRRGSRSGSPPSPSRRGRSARSAAIQSGSDSTGTNPPPRPPSAIAPRLVTALTCWIVLSAAAAASPAPARARRTRPRSATTASHEPETAQVQERDAEAEQHDVLGGDQQPPARRACRRAARGRDSPAARSRGHVRQPCSRKIAKPTTAIANDANTHAMPGHGLRRARRRRCSPRWRASTASRRSAASSARAACRPGPRPGPGRGAGAQLGADDAHAASPAAGQREVGGLERRRGSPRRGSTSPARGRAATRRGAAHRRGPSANVTSSTRLRRAARPARRRCRWR